MLSRLWLAGAVTASWISAMVTSSLATTIYTLDATSGVPFLVSSFSLTWDDVNNDHLLQIAERQSFSGITISGNFYGTVTNVPDIPNVAQFTTGPFGPSWWSFQSAASASVGIDPGYFTYQVTAPAPVPVPAVGAGLPGLVAAGALLAWWRRKRAAQSRSRLVKSTQGT
jgi:hypothetical protein